MFDNVLNTTLLQTLEAATRVVLWKKVFLQVHKIHRETLVPESFF